ncbi:hypothetical protein ACT4MK_22190 [Bradyrhizobium barranii]|uniref:hypothetical protein n=1 Tax=Bradyrhizobium barranii TaxID=2992140 RepID=UPI004033B2BE
MTEKWKEEIDRLRRFGPTWARLRIIGNSRPVQAATIFPVVGYFILLSSQVTGLFDGGIAGASHGDAIFAKIWALKLYFVYFGLISLGVGSAIYQLRCPRLIKKHADGSDFVLNESSVTTMENVKMMLRTVGYNETVNPSEVLKDYFRIPAMKNFYARQSAEQPWSRVATTFFFGAGFILLGVPSLLTLSKVAMLFFSQISGPL